MCTACTTATGGVCVHALPQANPKKYVDLEWFSLFLLLVLVVNHDLQQRKSHKQLVLFSFFLFLFIFLFNLLFDLF
jgi:apolipoprotein N-acyltransferase